MYTWLDLSEQKKIESPERLLEIFEDYVKETKGNPITVKDWVGKDATQITREKEKPLTIEGLELYCFKHGFISDLGDYFSNNEERYTDYATICSIIKKTVKNDQILGGMAGIYNPSITQRLNNLAETVNQTTKHSGAIMNIDPLAEIPNPESEGKKD